MSNCAITPAFRFADGSFLENGMMASEIDLIKKRI